MKGLGIALRPFFSQSHTNAAHALICSLVLTLYRVIRMRLKANASSVSPEPALELLGRIQQHRARIGQQAFTGISKSTEGQLDWFGTLEVPTPR